MKVINKNPQTATCEHDLPGKWKIWRGNFPHRHKVQCPKCGSWFRLEVDYRTNKKWWQQI